MNRNPPIPKMVKDNYILFEHKREDTLSSIYISADSNLEDIGDAFLSFLKTMGYSWIQDIEFCEKRIAND